MASSMIPILLFLSAFHVLLCRSELSNTDFFLFPLRSDEVPIVHSGDIVNVTWLSQYDRINLYLGCADGQADSYEDQPGSGNIVLTVNSTWTSPCHWQLVKRGDEKHYFDSGQIDVTNAKATPAVTWIPSSLATPSCGVQTISASGQSTGASSPVAIATVTATSGCSNSTSNNDNSHEMGTGASIGVGIVAGVAAGALVGTLTLMMHRRLHKKRQEKASIPTGGVYYPAVAGAYYPQQYYPQQFNPQPYNPKYNIPELHSQPVQ
ncbi:uncharacterized protein K452DRAFT_360287 [Aplosporella prunicola CBS 121167]|uniref:Mid2 domain-containing protein n=1 Tax=Aplosporella prunicola CBS 121167 TaxID=1176127 RepID=A0A6A6B7Z5_9PEZI|nr:uncharacterized protein K452DRAFT_360287 [Aplosporella prunicola CBS 121167]KAF2139483.1 hypothetical protein K452DRAFT_360287 [Aplosporella prunicola CBS 121167]